MPRINSFDEFWLFYVREHANPLNRQLHFIGSSCGLVCLFLGIAALHKAPSEMTVCTNRWDSAQSGQIKTKEGLLILLQKQKP